VVGVFDHDVVVAGVRRVGAGGDRRVLWSTGASVVSGVVGGVGGGGGVWAVLRGSVAVGEVAGGHVGVVVVCRQLAVHREWGGLFRAVRESVAGESFVVVGD